MNPNTFSAQLSDLYSREEASLRRWAAQRLRGREDVEDALQETYRRLAERGTFEGISNPAAFAMGTLRNVVASMQRSYASSGRTVPLSESGDAIVPAAPDVADQYLDSERKRLVSESVKAVRSSTARELLNLIVLGYKPAVIAGLPLTSRDFDTPLAVRRALRNAKRSLRNECERRGIGPAIILLPLRARVRSWVQNWTKCLLRAVAEFPDLQGLMAQGVVAITLFGISSGVAPAPVSAAAANPSPPKPTEVSIASTMAQPSPFALWPSGSDHGANAVTPSSPTGSAENRGSMPILPGNPKSSETLKGTPRSEGESQDPIFPPDKMRIDTPLGSGEYNNRRETNHDEPAPSLAEQTLDLIQRREQIPLPECWGIEVCEELPKNL